MTRVVVLDYGSGNVRSAVRALERTGDGDTAELCGRLRLQPSKQAPHRGAGSGNDHISGHWDLRLIGAITVLPR